MIGAALFLMADGGSCPRCTGPLTVTLDALHRPRTRCVRCQGVAPYRVTQTEIDARALIVDAPVAEIRLVVDVREVAFTIARATERSACAPDGATRTPAVMRLVPRTGPAIPGTRLCADDCGRYVNWCGRGRQPKRCDTCAPKTAAQRAGMQRHRERVA